MFEARFADGNPIDIDQFRYLENADRLVLFCKGCNAEVLAVAWKPGIEYKLSSHFRLSPGHDHAVGCSTEAYEEFTDSGKQRIIRSASDIPGGYPARLVFRKEERLTEVGVDRNVPAKHRYVSGSGEPSDGSSSMRGGNTTSSLLQACRFYILNPELRDLPFKADGVEGSKYREAFQSLHSFPRERKLSKRIFYGSLLFKMELRDSVESLQLCLVQKIRGENERRYRLDIYWKSWSEIRKANFKKLIDEKRGILKEQWIREKKSSSLLQSCLYIFFIGDQSEDDLAVFRVSDHRNVCILPSSYEAV
jgi:hypothetical protein